MMTNDKEKRNGKSKQNIQKFLDTKIEEKWNQIIRKWSNIK